MYVKVAMTIQLMATHAIYSNQRFIGETKVYFVVLLCFKNFCGGELFCVQKRVSFPYSGTRLNNNEKIQATGVVYFRAGIMSSQRRP